MSEQLIKAGWRPHPNIQNAWVLGPLCLTHTDGEGWAEVAYGKDVHPNVESALAESVRRIRETAAQVVWAARTILQIQEPKSSTFIQDLKVLIRRTGMSLWGARRFLELHDRSLEAALNALDSSGVPEDLREEDRKRRDEWKSEKRQSWTLSSANKEPVDDT